ncbi:MAG: hypothetical protein R2830_19265 [Saprospiraceae bacterium]
MKAQNKNSDRRRFLIATAILATGVPIVQEVSAVKKFTPASPIGDNEGDLCTPKSLFSNMEDWVNRSGNDKYYYGIEAVRIKQSTKNPEDPIQDNVVSYLEAYEFAYNPKEKIFQGDLEQVFSDRNIGSQRFDKNKKDIMNLKFTRDGKIRFTLKTWGNYSAVFEPQCKRGTLFGYDPDGLFWVINFTQKLSAG